jgi:hypothetical protein
MISKKIKSLLIIFGLTSTVQAGWLIEQDDNGRPIVHISFSRENPLALNDQEGRCANNALKNRFEEAAPSDNVEIRFYGIVNESQFRIAKSITNTMKEAITGSSCTVVPIGGEGNYRNQLTQHFQKIRDKYNFDQGCEAAEDMGFMPRGYRKALWKDMNSFK